MIRRSCIFLLVATCSMVLLAGLTAHPFRPVWPGALVTVFLVAVWYVRARWIALYLALLPVIDLSPFSGWLFFDDFDFASLAVLIAGYTRLYLLPVKARAADRLPEWREGGLVLVTLYLAALIASVAAALLPLAPLDANAFSNFFSRYNALRLAKAPLTAALLMPLVWREFSLNARKTRHAIGTGMVGGLALAAASVFWERAAFVSLSDFSSEFRATGLFASTNTGGAALDAFLALTIPFCIAGLLRERSTWRFAVLTLVLVAGAYSVFVTFSRSLYGAVAVVVVGQIFAWSWASSRATSGTALLRTLLVAGLATLTFFLLEQVFAVAGYRGMLAVAGCMMVLYLLSATPMRAANLRAIALGGAAWALLLLSGFFVARAWYAGYAAIAAVQLWLLFGDPGRRLRFGWVCSGVLSGAAAMVALGWGGTPALSAAAVALAVAWALAILNAALNGRLWRVNAASFPVAFLGGSGLVLAVVISNSWFASNRFETVAGDWAGRMHHWRDVAAAMDTDPSGLAFGTGVGRMPEVYFWRNGGADMSGNFSFAEERDNRFLRISGGRYTVGYGDPIRVMQHLSIESPRLKVTLDLRTASPATTLQIDVCARHVIYAVKCQGRPVGISADAAWHRHSVEIDTSALRQAGLWSAPTFLVLATETQKSLIDIDNVEVAGVFGESLRNGNFSGGMDFWFFTSDRSHLSWHAKNAFLHVLFEQGIVGLGLLTAMLVLMVLRMRVPMRDAQAGSVAIGGAIVGSITGFLGVGAFDSLFDAPRVALLFYLVLFGALVLPIRMIFDASEARVPPGA